MSYYKVLGFECEPFSTSPDPDFLYLTQEHEQALTNLLIELRLKRGLSVVLGDIGTGKTTLSRKLIRCLRDRGDFIVHLVLDPCFESEYFFLVSLIRNLGINVDQFCRAPFEAGKPTMLDLKEAIEKFLYQKCIVEQQTVVLIIDEAQKLTETAMEMLRLILNYETNQSKLLQLVLLGQLELHSKIVQMQNFMDRVSFKFALNPLSLKETTEMIHFRMKQAGYTAQSRLFLDDSIRLIHEVSKGYPRKIMSLCHRSLKSLVMLQKYAVDEKTVREIINEDVSAGWLTPMLH